MCLIDSDINQKTTKFHDKKIESNLKLNRIQNHDHEISLCGINSAGNYVATAIEDCLDPNLFYQALTDTFNDQRFKDEQEIFQLFEQNDSFESSRITGETCLLKPKTIEALDKKMELIKTIQQSDFKVLLAANYCKLAKGTEIPHLFKLAIDFFNNKTITT